MMEKEVVVTCKDENMVRATELPTYDEIVQEAKHRYPYLESDGQNRINKMASKRRNFIEGAAWFRDKMATCTHEWSYKILYDHTAADVCNKCGEIRTQP